MKDWDKKRKEWQTARDNHDVKKGAGKGVSIGDAIDKVVKAGSKSYGAVLKALTELEADLTKYQTQIAKAHPKFDKWIDANIRKDITALRNDIAFDVAQLVHIRDIYLKDTLRNESTMWPTNANLSTALTLMKGDDKGPRTWDDASKAASLFKVPIAVLPYMAKRGDDLRKLAWKVRLPGLEKDYAYIKTWGERLIEDAKFLIKWSKVPGPAEFSDIEKESHNRDSALEFKLGSDPHGTIKGMIG